MGHPKLYPTSLLQFRGIIKVKLIFFRNLSAKSENDKPGIYPRVKGIMVNYNIRTQRTLCKKIFAIME